MTNCESIGVPRMNTYAEIIDYYNSSPEYLTGPLGGTCHFGLTPEDEKFELKAALHNMEMLLGRKLDLPPGSTVIDAGTGFGRVAETLAKEFNLKIIGLDLIPERLLETKEYAEKHGVSKEVLPMNATYCDLPVDSSSVGGVYTMETLVHADRLKRALSEFRRVLKPGGRLVLFEYSVPDESSLGLVRKVITDNMVKRTGMASIKDFTHGIFPDLLETAGFENIEVEDISKNVWPTWHWFFKQGVRNVVPSLLKGQLFEQTNLLGSLMIWPYRHQLRYNVVTANKPI